MLNYMGQKMIGIYGIIKIIIYSHGKGKYSEQNNKSFDILGNKLLAFNNRIFHFRRAEGSSA